MSLDLEAGGAWCSGEGGDPAPRNAAATAAEAAAAVPPAVSFSLSSTRCSGVPRPRPAAICSSGDVDSSVPPSGSSDALCLRPTAPPAPVPVVLARSCSGGRLRLLPKSPPRVPARLPNWSRGTPPAPLPADAAGAGGPPRPARGARRTLSREPVRAVDAADAPSSPPESDNGVDGDVAAELEAAAAAASMREACRTFRKLEPASVLEPASLRRVVEPSGAAAASSAARICSTKSRTSMSSAAAAPRGSTRLAAATAGSRALCTRRDIYRAQRALMARCNSCVRHIDVQRGRRGDVKRDGSLRARPNE